MISLLSVRWRTKGRNGSVRRRGSPIRWVGDKWISECRLRYQKCGFERLPRGARNSAEAAWEPGASRGVFGVERFSFVGLSELVGHEMQHGGQRSEAGGGK